MRWSWLRYRKRYGRNYSPHPPAPVRGTSTSLGATLRSNVQDVGEGIRTATVLDPFGNIFGIIENPHFKLP